MNRNRLPNAEREGPVEDYFRDQVRRRLGGIVVKFLPVIAGVPDRIVLLPGGRVLLVELKAHDGATRAVQQAFHARARALGVRVHLVRGRSGVDAWVRNRAEELYELTHPAGRASLVDDREGPQVVLPLARAEEVLRYVKGAPDELLDALTEALLAPVELDTPAPAPCDDDHGPVIDGICRRCWREVA